jgi:hypothetical protein
MGIGCLFSGERSWKRHPDAQKCLTLVTLDLARKVLWILREWKSYLLFNSDAVLSRKVTWNRRKHLIVVHHLNLC